MKRVLVALAGISGLAGVILAAMGTHGPASGATMTIAANFLLFHAPVLLALAGAAQIGLLRSGLVAVAAGLIAAGLALFSGDLAIRASLARPLFAFAAPIGGGALMLGWLAILVSGLVGPARDPRP